MANFPLIFGLSLVVNVGITFRSSDLYKKFVSERNSESSIVVESEKELAQKKQWETVLRKYLAVYLLATLSDWLQGPYVYALYADYGYSQHDIAVLFVAGFGSSMVFGSFIGGMADWGGRRNFVILYAIIYAASCVTKRKLQSLHVMRSVELIIATFSSSLTHPLSLFSNGRL
jgi:type IV secretory pathway VirB2 component (pilin)